MPKKNKGYTLLASPGIVCYAEKRNNFYSSVPGPNSPICHLKISLNFVELFWSSCGLKKFTIIVAFHFQSKIDSIKTMSG